MVEKNRVSKFFGKTVKDVAKDLGYDQHDAVGHGVHFGTNVALNVASGDTVPVALAKAGFATVVDNIVTSPEAYDTFKSYLGKGHDVAKDLANGFGKNMDAYSEELGVNALHGGIPTKDPYSNVDWSGYSKALTPYVKAAFKPSVVGYSSEELSKFRPKPFIRRVVEKAARYVGKTYKKAFLPDSVRKALSERDDFLKAKKRVPDNILKTLTDYEVSQGEGFDGNVFNSHLYGDNL
jgi:hypothetical protein